MFNFTDEEKEIRVAFYLRVSTDDQVRGFGIDMQRSSLYDLLKIKTNWIHKKEWEFIDEGCSGGDLNRPEFQKMLKAVEKKEIDLIVVYKIDRISRNLTHLLNVFQKLQKHDASIYSIKENIDFSNSIGRLAFHMFGALAEFERDTIRMRTTDGIIASGMQGNYVGGNIPLGYRKIENIGKKGSRLVIVPEEVKIVQQLFDWFVFDKKNYEQIRNLFNELKISKGTSFKGKNPNADWHESTIKNMLSNRIYIGERYKIMRLENGKEVILKTITAPIIDETIFRQAQYLIEEVSLTKGKKGGGYNRYLLSRKIIYKDDGNYFTGYQRTKGGSAYRHKKNTKNGIEYPNVEIAAKIIDGFVWDRIIEAIKTPEVFFNIYERQTKNSNNLKSLEKEQFELRDAIALEENKILKISNDYYDGKISEEREIKLIDLCNQKIEASKERYNKLEEEIKKLIHIEIVREKIDRFSKAYKRSLEKVDDENKQSLVETLIDSVVVWKEDDDIKIVVNFRFAKNSDEENMSSNEPKDIANTIKKEENNKVSLSNGGE